MEHEKLQTAKDDWDEDIMKQVEFINKRLHRRNEAKACTSNIDKKMLEYYEVLTKPIIRFLPTLRRSKKMLGYYLVQCLQVWSLQVP